GRAARDDDVPCGCQRALFTRLQRCGLIGAQSGLQGKRMMHKRDDAMRLARALPKFGEGAISQAIDDEWHIIAHRAQRGSSQPARMGAWPRESASEIDHL